MSVFTKFAALLLAAADDPKAAPVTVLGVDPGVDEDNFVAEVAKNPMPETCAFTVDAPHPPPGCLGYFRGIPVRKAADIAAEAEAAVEAEQRAAEAALSNPGVPDAPVVVAETVSPETVPPTGEGEGSGRGRRGKH